MTDTLAAPTIRILPPELISRIAAGEVVERPASVLKELVENALDAGAHRIRADLESGGIGLVRVTDDGCGLAATDLPLAVQPHATSKLTAAEQLHALSTLGFRGEALPSIASVSRFALSSRRRPGGDEESRELGIGNRGIDSGAEDMAWRIDVVGGQPRSPEPRPAAGPYGTTVEARDLFFNLPARQKFLKGLAAEAAACADTLLRLALTRPDVAFTLNQGRSELVSLSAACARPAAARADTNDHTAHTAPELPAAAYFRRAREALGRANAGGLVEVDYASTLEGLESADGSQRSEVSGQGSGCRLYGLLSPPAVTRPNRGLIYLTVNGRAVKDRTLTSALLEAYRHLLPPRRFPIAVLYLEVPGGDVDINVHPAKSEVRFRQPGRIYALFYRAVRAVCGLEGTGNQERGLRNQESMGGSPEAGGGVQRVDDGGSLAGAVKDFRAPRADLVFAPSGPLFADNAPWPQAECQAEPVYATETSDDASAVSEAPAPFSEFVQKLAQNPIHAPQPAADYRIIGQAAASYIVVEDESGVRLIDQHALHERILFERLLSSARAESRGDAQGLLVPETVELSAAQAALVSASPEALELLAHLGFDCDPFGPRALLVRSIPAVLKRCSPARLVSELLESLATGDDTPGGGSKALKRWTLREKTAYILSCKAAIKAGERLTQVQMEALIAEFHAVAGPLTAPGALTCPHGRPLALEFSWYDLERAVGRK